MTLATPGFRGERLREAREARGISQTDLARLIDVTRQAVSSFEKGVNSPAPTTTRKIADTLGVTPRFFQRSEPLGSSMPRTSPTYFRSFARTKAGDRAKGQFRIDLVADLVALTMDEVEYPDVVLPRAYLGDDPTSIDEAFIEQTANRLRAAWGLGSGPIENVVWALENHGIVVVFDEVATDAIDAFSEWRGDTPIVMLGSNKQSAVRSRWDACHELGHLSLHRYIERTWLSEDGFKLIEDQANFFAQCFLLPREGYERSIIVPSLEEFRVAKSKWKVSIQAQLERSFKLALISESSRTRMWQKINRNGWKKREPLDDELPMEAPVLIKKAFEMVVRDGIISYDQIEDATGIPAMTVLNLVQARPLAKEPMPANVVSISTVRGERDA